MKLKISFMDLRLQRRRSVADRSKAEPLTKAGLRSLFFHRAECGSRDFYLFARTVFERDSNRTKIRQETSLCFVVRVTDVVSGHRAFAGYRAFSCHCFAFLKS